MLTKGYIIELPKFNNKYKVRIPIFETAGIGNTKSVFNASVIEATLAYTPGNINGLVIGDCVFIGFENDNQSKPVILGKLYLGKEQETQNNSFNYSLEVTNSAELPINTVIGNISADRIKQTVFAVEDCQISVYNISINYKVHLETSSKEFTFGISLNRNVNEIKSSLTVSKLASYILTQDNVALVYSGYCKDTSSYYPIVDCKYVADNGIEIFYINNAQLSSTKIYDSDVINNSYIKL